MRGEPATAATPREVAGRAARRLAEAGVPEPEASAAVLLAELLGVGRATLSVIGAPVAPETLAVYEGYILRRLAREPVQRILGYAYFRNLRLLLNADTLIPRPDTETVVEAALEAADGRGGSPVVLDVGTGSGAIAIAIAQERPPLEVHATEISAGALAVARRNAAENGARVLFHRADVVGGVEGLAGRVGLLVSNPPYVGAGERERLAPEVIEWDPHAALFSEGDGYHFYRRLFAETPPLLLPGADVVLEVGDRQAEGVLALGEAAGFAPLGIREDLAGSPRAVLLRWGA